MGATLAPAQIQNWPDSLVVRADSGMGCRTSSTSTVASSCDRCLAWFMRVSIHYVVMQNGRLIQLIGELAHNIDAL